MASYWHLILCYFYITEANPLWFYRNAPLPVRTVDIIPSGLSDSFMHFESDMEPNDIKKSHTWMSKEKQRTLTLILEHFKATVLENSFGSKVTCAACKAGVGVLKFMISAGLSEDEVGWMAEEICTHLNIQPRRVCKGLSGSFKHEVLYVFKNSKKFSLYEICEVVVGENCSQSSPEFNWTVPLPHVPKPPIHSPYPPQPEAPKLRVLHLSDTHFDMYYREGSNADCGELLCCREGIGNDLDVSKRAGYWGDYRKCDTPLHTIENMLAYISKNFQVDYILWTGDLPPHDVWNQTKISQIYVLRETTKLFLKYFPETPIFPALGNHESAPVNSFPPPFVRGNDSISWLYDELDKSWAKWLPNYTLPTIKNGAFYSVLVSPGFRIISLNLNYCNNLNWWLLLNTTDPANELQWLVNELQQAELIKEKVHIIGHIPPGNDDCLKVWSSNYYKIINRYESTVTAQFFGHTHVDEFEIFYDEVNKTRPVGLAYIAPSITPYFPGLTPYVGLNPAFRIYTFDGFYANSSFSVLNHENYMMDLAAANNNSVPVWKKLYSAKDDYKMFSLEPRDWDKLVKQMIADDAIFQKFFRYYHRNSSVYPPCDQKCKKKLLCALISGKSHEPSQCYQLRKLGRN